MRKRYKILILCSCLCYFSVMVAPVFASQPPFESVEKCKTDKNTLGCLSYFAAQDNDISICLNNQFMDEKCFWYYASWKKSASICDSIGRYSNLKPGMSDYGVQPQWCYLEAAISSENSDICPRDEKYLSYCMGIIKKIKLYSIFLPIAFVLFISLLVFLLLFNKKTVARLSIAFLVAMVLSGLVFFIRASLEFLKVYDFFFPYSNLGRAYAIFVEKYFDLGGVLFIFVFMFLAVLYIPSITLVKAFSAYRIGDGKWKMLLITFFCIHIASIFIITTLTAGYGLYLAITASAVSAGGSLLLAFLKIKRDDWKSN